MKDMIERIIEMDTAARELTQRAQKDKINSEQEIEKKKEEIRSQYLERARKRISINEVTEKKLAQEKMKKIRDNQNEISHNLKERYEKMSDEWVDMIVKRVLEGWFYAF